MRARPIGKVFYCGVTRSPADALSDVDVRLVAFGGIVDKRNLLKVLLTMWNRDTESKGDKVPYASFCFCYQVLRNHCDLCNALGQLSFGDGVE